MNKEEIFLKSKGIRYCKQSLKNHDIGHFKRVDLSVILKEYKDQETEALKKQVNELLKAHANWVYLALERKDEITQLKQQLEEKESLEYLLKDHDERLEVIGKLTQQLEESKRENEAYKNTLKEVYRILPRKDCNQKVLSIISKDNF